MISYFNTSLNTLINNSAGMQVTIALSTTLPPLWFTINVTLQVQVQQFNNID